MSHWGRTLAWWYWLATVALLGPALFVPSPGALAATLAVSAAQTAHLRVRAGAWGAFPVQVRLAFLALFVAGLREPVAGLHGLMLAGTAVRVVFDYGLLARTMSLLPWNRDLPLDAALLRRTYLTPPSRWRFAPPVRGTRIADAAAVRPGA